MRRKAFPQDRPTYDRATLKSLIQVIPGGKAKVGKERNPKLLSETKEITSPFDTVDDAVVFTIKKATNREDVARSNLFARVEYVTEDDSGALITRREFPLGDLQVATIKLCLVSWDIMDMGREVPITEQSILDYLRPEERVWLYEQVLDFNPIWTNRAAERKN